MNDSVHGEIKYVSISRVADAYILISLPSSTTKKAYAEEVSLIIPLFLSNILLF